MIRTVKQRDSGGKLGAFWSRGLLESLIGLVWNCELSIVVSVDVFESKI